MPFSAEVSVAEMIDPGASSQGRGDEVLVGRWLLLCCGLLLALVMLGGATRLTESGLSIVDWRPVTGVLPPLGDAEWQEEFQRYKDSPQYRLVNQGMGLAAFKYIFWFEYGHRLLARLLGVAFALPLAWFWLRGRIPRRLRGGLLATLALGAAQGYMGWYMVKSGLVDLPRVSHYRLAAHLGLALLIFASMWWLALECLRPQWRHALRDPASRWLLRALLVLVGLTIVFGAFVAGLRAGLIYNTFPRMGDEWVPDVWLALQPWWRNFVENPVAIQFTHRCLALGTFAACLALFWHWRGRGTRAQRNALAALFGLALVQVGLGIATLLAKVPVMLGTLHQGGAVLLLAAALVVVRVGLPPRASGGVPDVA